MYDVRRSRSNVRSPVEGVCVPRWISNFNAGYILIIIAVTVFLFRAIGVINKYQERGAYSYIQMMNFSMPIVEMYAYDEMDFEENILSLKRVAIEALGISNINPLNILGKEISFLESNYNGSFNGGKLKGLKPFSLNDDSIVRMTPEEIAELNKKSPAYDQSLKKALDNSNPEILIYSTHNTEAYAEAKAIDSTDNSFNVVGVAEVLAKELEDGYGISVIHDKTAHNIGAYNESYDRAQNTVQSYLNKYGDFKLIIDIHRDSVGDNKNAVTSNINDQDLAKIMFVRAENSERYEANKKLTDELQAISNELFPGLARGIYTYPIGKLSIHQKLSDGALLIEMGADVNTAQEAKLSAKYIARIIAEYLNRQESE